MFLSKWVDRIGQIVAPDKNYSPDPDEGATSPFWDTVAPDPNFESSPQHAQASRVKSPSRSAFKTPLSQQQQQQLVECEHCHKLTPSSPPESSTTPFHTPVALGSGKVASTTSEMKQVEGQVIGTVKDIARALKSPVEVRNKHRTLFTACTNKTKARLDKNLAKIEKMIRNNPSFLSARSCGLGKSPPDGFTPLMAAALTDNVEIAKLLLELGLELQGSAEQLEYRDIQGKTAYHIASEMGHLEVIEFLKEKYSIHYGDAPPLDLCGGTPYGVAMTSPEPKARSNRKELNTLLYSDKDRSILGTSAPAQQRMHCSQALQLAFGIADMPGKRITMEDAMVASVWDDQESGSGTLLGICDGHQDGGYVSDFIAQVFPQQFQSAMTSKTGDWKELSKEICLSVDAQLKQTNMPGGSTAVLALITPKEIVVSNVGDSRCILIQKSSKSGESLEESVEQLTLGEEEKESSPLKAPVLKDYKVIALSQDHKANLEEEKSRVEAAGLTVFEEKYTDQNGEECVLYKVAVSEQNLLSTSRSFGDFEYKANEELPADEQAVVAVPDVVVHQRSKVVDAYVVLACDGVWDVMTNEQVGQFIVENIHSCTEDAVLPTVADRLLSECLARGSTDNMSVIVVALSSAAEKLSDQVSGQTNRALIFETTS